MNFSERNILFQINNRAYKGSHVGDFKKSGLLYQSIFEILRTLKENVVRPVPVKTTSKYWKQI
jgi:hypothetical protein